MKPRLEPTMRPRNEPTTRRWAAIALILAGAAGAAGCGGRSFVPATPPGFLDLEDRYGDDEYRATTADGVILGVRVFENKPKGELTFWARSVENRMRDVGGYALLDTREVQLRTGLKGTQLRFGHDEAKTPHLYVVSVFVNEERIFLLEAGGAKDQMEKLMPQIEWSVRNFLPK
jgi:hypothetical protein